MGWLYAASCFSLLLTKTTYQQKQKVLPCCRGENRLIPYFCDIETRFVELAA
jgi:hypothetical protein